MKMRISTVLNLISPEYLTHKPKDHHQCQLLAGGILTTVDDNQVHHQLLRNTFLSLRSQLKPGRSSLYALNLQLKIRHLRLNAQPELVIVPSSESLWSKISQPWLNPTVIIEVLIPDEERERKFNWYRQIASLCEYVRIEPKCYLIEHFEKIPGKEWKMSQIKNRENNVYLASVGCHFSLATVYDQVDI